MRPEDRPPTGALARLLQRTRGRTLASLFSRWQRASWERTLEKAEEEARRLAEEAKARNRGGPPRY